VPCGTVVGLILATILEVASTNEAGLPLTGVRLAAGAAGVAGFVLAVAANAAVVPSAVAP
jgi:hypothetical protein